MAALITKNYTWNQNEDLDLRFTFKRGADAASAVPVDLTGWQLRMDIASQTGGRLYTFNSADIDDVDTVTEGDQPDVTKEAVLGSDGSIVISVPRSLTLPGGTIHQAMTNTPPQNIFNYDVFLRDNGTPAKQFKFAAGTVTVEKSVTIWV